MKKIVFLLTLTALFAINFQLSSCHSKSGKSDMNIGQEEEDMISKSPSELKQADFDNAKATKKSSAKKDKAPGGREADDVPPIKEAKKSKSKIIKNANIKYRVEEYEKAYIQVTDIVNQHGAYISNEDAVKNNYSLYNQLEIRCDADKFDNLVNDLMKISIYVDFKKISAEDVTDQFVDMQARLKAKTEVEGRLKSILQKARTIQEILEVEKEIKYVREEIETIEGRLKYLSDRVSYSTIKLHIYEDIEFKSAPEKGFGYKFVKALKAGWDGLQIFIIGIFYLWPLWLILGGVLWLILRLVKRGKRSKS